MTVLYEDSSSIPEKLTLLAFIAAIIIGNICVFITYLIRADGKHWSNVFILGMAFVDLFIGSFVLPMRFVSAYGNPLTARLCTALVVGESSALASVIYSILFMVSFRLYDLRRTAKAIRRRYIVLLLVMTWLASFLFYSIPFMIDSSSYLLEMPSTTEANTTAYCTTYTVSVYHPSWLTYTEIGVVYSFPLLCILIGVIFCIGHICQRRPKGLNPVDRKQYAEQKKMTRHVLILSGTFLCLWSPWIAIRIVIMFMNTSEMQRALQITYYILIFKSVLFPILYAATNSSFRGSFAIYRHRRVLGNNRVWSVS